MMCRLPKVFLLSSFRAVGEGFTWKGLAAILEGLGFDRFTFFLFCTFYLCLVIFNPHNRITVEERSENVNNWHIIIARKGLKLPADE